ncbi:MAG TPA: tetratricopeptide repeat protein [Rhizomicrobium sp.]
MNRASAWNATSVLCALWLGACASTPDGSAKPGATTFAAAKLAATAPANAAPTDAGLLAGADLETIKNDLPATLEGEIKRAQLLRSHGDLDDALRALAQLMLVAPDDARVIGEYGKVLAQQGHAQAALPFLQRAAELQPKDWTLYSALGVAYDQTDDHPHAKLAYEHALALSPGQPAVLNNLAVSRMLAGDLAGAQRLLGQASAAGSTNPKIANNSEKLDSLRGAAAPSSGHVVSTTTLNISSAAAHSRAAVAAPQPIAPVFNSAVVMQTVPADPLAGPVKPKAVVHAKLANSAKPKPPAPLSPPPALRTAAETN